MKQPHTPRPATPRVALALLTLCLTLCACHYSFPRRDAAASAAAETPLDSIGFRTLHHYWKGYCFETLDSLALTQRPQPAVADDALADLRVSHPEAAGAADSLALGRKEKIVVADILYLPADTIDSVWVKVARDPQLQGWLHESELLARSVPDEPIAKCIRAGADSPVALPLFAVALAAVALLLRRSKGSRLYPALLLAALLCAALLYAGIRHYAPQTWQEFYFHPTLNPFSTRLPLALNGFVGSVWALIVSAVATLIDRYHGRQPRYLCGHCGKPLDALGRCPNCGIENK